MIAQLAESVLDWVGSPDIRKVLTFCQAERLKTQHEPRLETPSTYVTEMCRVVQVRCTDPQKTMVARALVDSDILISHQSLSLSSASISTGSAR